MKSLMIICICTGFAVLPGLVMAAKAKATRGFKACQVQAIQNYQKRAVEIEMAAIAGDLNEVEAGRKRENLQSKLRQKNDSCARLARGSASPRSL